MLILCCEWVALVVVLLCCFNDGYNAGGIPVSLAQLTNLESLDLYHNQLSGERHSLLAIAVSVICCCGFYDMIVFNTEPLIPFSLGQLTKLQWLNLSENQLSGKRHSLLAVVGGILCCFGFYDVIIFEIELLAFARIWSFNVELSCGWDTVVVALLRCFDDGLMQAKFLQVWGSSPTSKGWIFGATNWVVKSHPSFLWLFSACTHLLCCLSVIILSNFFFSIHLLILISLFYLCCWRTHSLWFRLIACYCGWLSLAVKLYFADL